MPSRSNSKRSARPSEALLARRVRAEIRRDGPLSFARFMERALYDPEHGYYESGPRPVGRSGDFYTSVSVGPLFGRLMAAQLARWLEPCGSSEPLLIEAGAHDGQLARDILEAWPPRAAPPRYCILEPSPRRRRRQQELLALCPHPVQWIADWSELPAAGIRGAIFSNELLDAMPVHRFGWDARRHEWFEWGVAIGQDSFVWARLPMPAAGIGPAGAHDWTQPAVPPLPEELLAVLPDGFTVDLSPAAAAWWRAAASRLAHGWLATLDYGLDWEDMLDPSRAAGTLRAYRQHRASADVFAHLGAQDLTAHVNWTALRETGESAGLRTAVQTTQAAFLTGILAGTDPAIGEAPLRMGEERQWITLTHPDHLGWSFRILAQRASCDDPAANNGWTSSLIPA